MMRLLGRRWIALSWTRGFRDGVWRTGLEGVLYEYIAGISLA